MTRPYTRRLLAAFAALALLPAVGLAEDALPPRDPQTIAQTIVALDGQPLRWLVSLREAGNGATAGDGSPALLVGATGRTAVDGSSGRAVLDPGEGYAIGDGGGASLEPAGDSGGAAWAIGFAVADAPDTDGAILLSDPFSPAVGDHELVLVRDVLAPRESAPLPASDAPVALLATDGLATIQFPDGETVSLSPGSAVAVDAASTVAAGEGGATVVAAALVPLAAAGPAPATPAAAQADAAGVIRIDLYACGPEVALPRIPAGACDRGDPGVDFQVFELGSGDNRRGMDDAAVSGARVEWSGLPDGEYLLNALSLPDGYARFYVPGLQGLNSPPERGYAAGPNEGYLLPLGPLQGRSWTINVYLLPGDAAPDAPASGSADVVIRFRECPAGVVAEPVMTGRGCQPVAPPESMVLDLVDPVGGTALGWEDAEPSDALSRTWRGVPAGDWLLTGEMSGVFGFAVRSSDPALGVGLKPDRSAYEVALRPAGDGPVFLDVYLLQEP